MIAGLNIRTEYKLFVDVYCLIYVLLDIPVVKALTGKVAEGYDLHADLQIGLFELVALLAL